MQELTHIARPSAVRYVTSDPDGVITAPRGTIAIDTTTGAMYRNRAGDSRWNLHSVPPEWGYTFFHDFLDILPFTASVVSGGTTSTASDTNILGAYRSTVTAATDAVIMRANVGTWTAGGGKYTFRARVRIPVLSDATNKIIVRVGPGDATTLADHTDGIYFENNFAANSDHVWRICTASNGTTTKTTTGIAAVANTWQTLEFTVNADASSVSGYIDTAAIPTPVTANIPASSSRVMCPGVFFVGKGAGSGALSAEIDWMGYGQVLSVARFL